MDDGYKVIQVDARKRERDIVKKLGRDFCRYLAEIITNCDDSYKFLEKNSKDTNYIASNKPIYIDIDFPKLKNYAVVTVVDNAEGMDAKRLDKVFEKYGADTAHGSSSGSRGLYGQGATDVMEAAKFNDNKVATIKSIKDGKLYEANFLLDSNAALKFKAQETPTGKENLAKIREKFNIPKNGTIVRFGVPDYVKVPSKAEDLIEKLEKFYQFRFLFASSNKRDVLLTVKKYNINSYRLVSDKYLFAETDVLSKQKFEFQNEDDVIKCDIVFFKNTHKDINLTNIIVVDDEYSVYDNTLFSFENDPQAANISGLLKISNFYEICKTRLNRTNKKKQAIVLDNRTGFDTKESFYKDLSKALYPVIKDIISKHGEEKKEVSLSKNKQVSSALNSINKYLNVVLDEEEGFGTLKGLKAPSEGIKFQRSSITTTAGKGYGLKLLINTDIVKPGDTINIECETLNHISYSPNNFVLESSDIVQENLAVKNIHIDALRNSETPVLMTAKTGKLETSVIITVTDEEIFYPTNGMEFNKNELLLVPGVKHFGQLFVDTNVIPIGSKINIISTLLKVDKDIVEVADKNIIGDSKIAKIKIGFNDGTIGSKYQIVAEFEDKKATLDIDFKNASDQSSGKKGLISDIRVKSTPKETLYQAWHQPDDGVLYISANNKINKVLIPNIEELDNKKPNFSEIQKKVVSDVVSFEISRLLVEKMIEKGKITLDEGNTNSYLNNLQKQKVEIFNIFYKALVESK